MFLTAQDGILGPFAWLLGKLFNLIYNLLAGSDGIANLGLCIIIFTVVVKLVLFPFTIKQQKASKINMMIQPELQKIQKKYSGKKDEKSVMMQQKEMKEVYNKYGTSMTGGCGTTLLQLPFIYALYRVIQNVPAYVPKVYNMYESIASSVMEAKGSDVQSYLSDFVNEGGVSAARYVMKTFEALTNVDVEVKNVIDVLSKFGVSNLEALLKDLSISDAAITGSVHNIEKVHSFILGINISEAPGWHLAWPMLIPVSAAVFQWLSMKVGMNNQAPTQENDPSAGMMKTMSYTMPIMSLFLTVSFPAAIGIYWSISALISALTQIGVNFYYDHADMDAILEKQMEIAKIKREKKGDKKSFYEKLMDQSAQLQEEMEKQEALKNNSAKSLKNYVAADTKSSSNTSQKKYKEGSIGAKANIMRDYNNSNNKEEK